MTLRYFLRSASVRAIIDAQHLTESHVAARVGVSRPYWSQLINAKRPLTPRTRRLLLACDVFAGVADSELWERVDTSAREAS
jgi:transcriptional regulator with XRE-family HTH domain